MSEDYHQKLDQAKRNVNQGIFGFELAKSKIDSIKGAFTSLAENINSESKMIRDEKDLE